MEFECREVRIHFKHAVDLGTRLTALFLVFLDLANSSGTFSLNTHHIPNLLNLPGCDDVLPPQTLLILRQAQHRSPEGGVPVRANRQHEGRQSAKLTLEQSVRKMGSAQRKWKTSCIRICPCKIEKQAEVEQA